jgi:hypothetical protein
MKTAVLQEFISRNGRPRQNDRLTVGPQENDQLPGSMRVLRAKCVLGSGTIWRRSRLYHGSTL